MWEKVDKNPIKFLKHANQEKLNQASLDSEFLNKYDTVINYFNDYSLLIAIMLSAQTTDSRVNEVTKVLFNKYDNLDKLNEAHSLAQKAYDVSVNRFAAGQTSATELSDVSSALYRMDMALLNAKYNILMSKESVKKLGE